MENRKVVCFTKTIQVYTAIEECQKSFPKIRLFVNFNHFINNLKVFIVNVKITKLSDTAWNRELTC